MTNPNILLIMCDQLRADVLGCYGNDFVKTPNIDRLAAEGICFDNAYSPTPVCIPARHAVISGKKPFKLGMLGNTGNREEIFARIKELDHQRTTKQPLQYPSAGSVFKRPEGYYAGKLIQDSDLKGCTVGGAQVSTVHCGFIINTGNATAEDVLGLIAKIQQTVKTKYGVDLEREVRVIGEE